MDTQTTHSHLRSYPPTPLHTHIPRLSSFIKTGVDELNDLLLNYSRIFDHLVYLNIRKSFGALYRMQNKVLCLFLKLFKRFFVPKCQLHKWNANQHDVLFYNLLKVMATEYTSVFQPGFRRILRLLRLLTRFSKNALYSAFRFHNISYINFEGSSTWIRLKITGLNNSFCCIWIWNTLNETKV